MRVSALILLGLLALAGCKKQDMFTQASVRTWDRSAFWRDGVSMRPPVDGTVARDASNPTVAQPIHITVAMLDRGHERYDIFCTPCHGRAGAGNGIIVQRGFQPPPSLTTDDMQSSKASRFYDAMSNGYGAMYSFADRLSPADRWNIVAYVRALQLSQDADPAKLPPELRARLAALR